MTPVRLSASTWYLVGLMVISFVLHFWLAGQLNIVEDESAYVQDAAQMRWDFLPFREFGATKGPFFLLLLKAWEYLAGESVVGVRLFPALAHVLSIPLLYTFARNITTRISIAAVASAWWAVSPAAVSLSTNVMHIPLELLLVLACFCLLSGARAQSGRILFFSALLFLLALLTRVTSAVFGPIILLLLLTQPGGSPTPLARQRIRPVIYFAVCFALLLGLLIAVIYPLYGWPKTAFFFNADATLIASKQRAVYAQAESLNIPAALFRAALPLWRDSLTLLLSALILPFAWRVRQPLLRLLLALALIAFFVLCAHALLADSFWAKETGLRTIMMQLCVAIWALTGAIVVLKPNLNKPKMRRVLLILILWVGSFILFYRGWGRSPTPFYPLESIPALAIASGLVISFLLDALLSFRRWQRWLWGGVLCGVTVMNIVLSFWYVPQEQYRGTVEVTAALAMGKHIRELVPAGEPLFTAQPIFAYLGAHPVYLGLTHPGWYLSERAGIVPAEIRRVFFPDFDVLLAGVARDINWIVVDWRTTDVYFNSGSEQTKPFRELLENDFEPVLTVPNPASRDIVLYRRRAAPTAH